MTATVTAEFAADEDLRDELAVAADFLDEHGFGRAADAVRVLYPRLPHSVLRLRRLFCALAAPDADLSPFELTVRFEGGGRVTSVRRPVTSVERRVEDARGDCRTLTAVLLADAVATPAAGQTTLTWVGVLMAGELIAARPAEAVSPAVMTPGDTANVRYLATVNDFLLPPGVAEAFVRLIGE